jgi:putative ABC transport system substrate-binding protein
MTSEHFERRAFIALLGAAGASAALARRAFSQQTGRPLVGLLSSGRMEQVILTAFKQGLSEAGFLDGRDADIEYRWADDQYDRLPPLAADLTGKKAWVIAAIGLVSALAAKPAVTKVPLVFVVEGDPVKFGLVNNLGQPGDKATGVSFMTSELTATQFDLLGQLVPNAPVTGLLINPNNPSNPQTLEGAQNAHPNKLVVAKAGQESDLDAAFASLAAQNAAALVVSIDPFLFDQRQKLVALAAQHKLPAIYPAREFADAGALMSYGPSISEACRQAGIYTGWTLKGTPVVQMPVQQSTKTEFVINLDTAQGLGLTVPVALLSRADSTILRR